MEPSLQLSIGQHLTITPQLQQAIRLLQLSTLDLQREIQHQVESNPMLEASPINDKDHPLGENQQRDLDDGTDFQWSELSAYDKHNHDHQFSDNQFNEHHFEHLHCTTTNLQDHLRWQLNLCLMSDIDRVIATAIIDAINDDGFLTVPVSDFHLSLNCEAFPLDMAEIEAVRRRVQYFDPVGCACVNLVETLLIQIEQFSLDAERLTLIKKIIIEDIELFRAT